MTACHQNTPCYPRPANTGIPALRSADPALLRAVLAALALIVMVGLPALMAPSVSDGDAASLPMEWHGNAGSAAQPR